MLSFTLSCFQDVRYLGLVAKTESKVNQRDPARCLVVFGMEPGGETSDAEAEQWFKEEVSDVADTSVSAADGR